MRRMILAAAACFYLSSACAAGTDTWMSVMLDGRKVGQMKTTRDVGPKGVTTSQVLDFRIARGKAPLDAHSEVTSLESLQGDPIHFVAKTKSSAQENIAEGSARGDGTFQVASTVGGAQKVGLMTWPAGATLSEGQRLAMVRHGFRPGTTYPLSNFDPVRQQVSHVQVTVLGDEMVDLPGGVERLHHLKQTLAGGPETEGIDAWVNDTGTVRRSIAPLLGFKMEMTACDRECADAPLQSLDVLRSAMVQSPRMITSAMRDDAIRYTISYRGKGSSPFIDTNEQAVTPIRDGRGGLYEMLVTAPQVRDDVPPPTPADTAANPWIQSTAPEVIALAQQAIGGAKTDLQRMRRMRSFVSSYIDGEGLDVAYGSALETIHTRRGDCTEYAVLLAAMARSVGIPTRVATGLIYTDRFAGATRMFVPHTWDQAWINGRWMSFDAALRSFDSTHIALSVGDGDPWRFFHVMDLLSDIRIEKATVPWQPTMRPDRPFNNAVPRYENSRGILSAPPPPSTGKRS